MSRGSQPSGTSHQTEPTSKWMSSSITGSKLSAANNASARCWLQYFFGPKLRLSAIGSIGPVYVYIYIYLFWNVYIYINIFFSINYICLSIHFTIKNPPIHLYSLYLYIYLYTPIYIYQSHGSYQIGKLFAPNFHGGLGGAWKWYGSHPQDWLLAFFVGWFACLFVCLFVGLLACLLVCFFFCQVCTWRIIPGLLST